jgi:hypothetical protein
MLHTSSNNWFFNPFLDTETRHYRLVHLINEADREFSAGKLLPFWNNLSTQMKQIKLFLEEQHQLQKALPKFISGIDLSTLSLNYENEYSDFEEKLDELKHFLTKAYPMLNMKRSHGDELYEYALTKLKLNPLGIIPGYRKQGLLLLSNISHKRIYTFHYELGLQRNPDVEHSALSIEPIGKYDYSIGQTPDWIKRQEIKKHNLYESPAAFFIESSVSYPVDYTLKPAAEKVLYDYLKVLG